MSSGEKIKRFNPHPQVTAEIFLSHTQTGDGAGSTPAICCRWENGNGEHTFRATLLQLKLLHIASQIPPKWGRQAEIQKVLEKEIGPRDRTYTARMLERLIVANWDLLPLDESPMQRMDNLIEIAKRINILNTATLDKMVADTKDMVVSDSGAGRKRDRRTGPGGN